MEKGKIRVMFYDDGMNSTTGYARVANALTKGLAKDCEFEVFNVNITDRNPATIVDGVVSLPCYGNRLDPLKSGFVSSIVNSISILQPHVFIPICDAFLLERDGISQIKFNNIKFMPYIPLDSNNLPTGSAPILDKADRILVQSEFAKNELKRYNYNSFIFRHGVDFEKFKENLQLREDGRKQFGIKDDEKVFLFIGRNTKRKRIPRILRGYAEFIKNNPEHKTKLILHGSEFDEYNFNLEGIINEIENQLDIDLYTSIIFPYKNHVLGKGVSDEDIIKLYNVCDWTISMSHGEGTGLLSLEGFANKKPTLYPENSNYKEILDEYIDDEIGLRKNGFEIKSFETEFVGINAEQPISSYMDLAKKLEYVCSLTDAQYERLRNNANNWIHENGDWGKILKELKTHIKEVIGYGK